MTTLFEHAALACPEVDFSKYVGNNSLLLEYIKHLRDVSKNGWLIKKVPDEYKTRGLYLAAVSNNGYVLFLIPNKHKDYNLCLKAVKQNGLAIIYVPDKFHTDELKCTAKESLHYTGDADADDHEFYNYVFGKCLKLLYEWEFENGINIVSYHWKEDGNDLEEDDEKGDD